MISDDAMTILQWTALAGYAVVLAFVGPLLLSRRGKNGYNSVVIGIGIFALLVGIAIANSLFLHIQGLGVIVLNLAWITLLYQTGVLAEFGHLLRGKIQRNDN